MFGIIKMALSMPLATDKSLFLLLFNKEKFYMKKRLSSNIKEEQNNKSKDFEPPSLYIIRKSERVHYPFLPFLLSISPTFF